MLAAGSMDRAERPFETRVEIGKFGKSINGRMDEQGERRSAATHAAVDCRWLAGRATMKTAENKIDALGSPQAAHRLERPATGKKSLAQLLRRRNGQRARSQQLAARCAE
uniref:Uncharacterized protein n=1 Tax=Plectus sambesii TaxID=2011161 RepID=A0A914V2F5_9BILA